ncbi:MAG: hypothetical protein Q9168_006042 [Polycauliona sp. 1 TL-2023]
MASTQDPAHKRIVGVITKCDIAQDRNQILSLAQNHEKHLYHGWFVVRNRNPEEIEHNISPRECQNREKLFFESAPWNSLPESQRGIQALKRFLANLLSQRIQENFPIILATLKDRQTTTSDDLNELGRERKTTEEKRSYLTAFAQQFHVLTSQAIDGRYHGLPNNALKIRKHIREANEAFATRMREEGHCVAFEEAPIQLDDSGDDSGDDSEDENDSDGSESPVTSKFHSTAKSKSKRGGLTSSQSGGGGPRLTPSHQTPKNNVGEQVPSTRDLHFQPIPIRDPSFIHNEVWLYHQSLYTGTPYDRFSPEEIRLSDYMQGQSRPNETSTGLFGSKSSAVGSGAKVNSSSFKFNKSSNSASTGVSFGQSSSRVGPTQQSSPSLSSSTSQPGERSSPIYGWIREEVSNSRGVELQGTLNPDVLPALFHRQIAKWKDLAKTHFFKATEIVGVALEAALDTSCKSDDTGARRLLAQVRQTEIAAEAKGLVQIRQRFNELASRHLQTQDLMFEEQIRKARLARFTAALKRYQSMTPNSSSQNNSGSQNGNATDNQVVVDLRNVTALFDQLHMSNAQNLEDDIHDILKSYYELALRAFVEYVNQHVVESYLTDSDGPVLFFNPAYVSQLSQESIEELGAEDVNIISKRKELQETMERLDRAEKIALKYT